MQFDLVLKKIRSIVLKVIESQDLQDHSLKCMCIELLMRMGTAAANPEDLILAAQYQWEFKIDLSKHLEFFLKQSEVFEEPKLQDIEEFNEDSAYNMTDKRRI